MADRYPKQLVGVSDGTATPPLKADGREVGATLRSYQYSKVPGTVWAAGADRFYLGKIPAGEKVTAIRLNTDTSLGTTTIDIGPISDPDKYVDGATVTATNAWVNIGPLAATLDDANPGPEELWFTVLTTNVASGTLLTVEVVTSGL